MRMARSDKACTKYEVRAEYTAATRHTPSQLGYLGHVLVGQALESEPDTDSLSTRAGLHPRNTALYLLKRKKCERLLQGSIVYTACRAVGQLPT